MYLAWLYLERFKTRNHGNSIQPIFSIVILNHFIKTVYLIGSSAYWQMFVYYFFRIKTDSRIGFPYCYLESSDETVDVIKRHHRFIVTSNLVIKTNVTFPDKVVLR